MLHSAYSKPAEIFFGFYETSSMTGQNITEIIKDVLLRLSLLMENLRGQTYDGAANLAGTYNGAQIVIRNIQPLALFYTAQLTALIWLLRQPLIHPQSCKKA